MKTNYYNRFKQNEKPEQTKKPLPEETFHLSLPSDKNFFQGVSPKASDTTEIKEKFAKVANCLNLNLRQKPNKLAPILSVITADSKVLLIETHKEWSRIVTESGLDGYVMTEYLEVM